MKNFEAKHGQCDSITFSQNIFFWRLKVIVRPLPCWQQASLVLICPGIYPQFIIELHVLHCLFVEGSNEKPRRGRIILYLTEGETFSFLMTTKCSCWYSHSVIPFLHPPRKAFSLPLRFGQEKNIPGHSIENRAYWFVLKIARVFPFIMSRNRMMNTFIIVNITPTCKR